MQQAVTIDWVELAYCVLVGVAIGSLCTTVAKTRAFAWLRTAVADLKVLGPLVRCPYCLAHWVSFFVIIAFHLAPTQGFWLRDKAPYHFIYEHRIILDLLIVWLVMVTVAGITSGLLCRALLQMEKLSPPDSLKHAFEKTWRREEFFLGKSGREDRFAKEYPPVVPADPEAVEQWNKKHLKEHA